MPENRKSSERERRKAWDADYRERNRDRRRAYDRERMRRLRAQEDDES